MQDDLSDLFFRNLSIANGRNASSPYVEETGIGNNDGNNAESDQPVKYSITQHYHHSAHLASSAPSTVPATPTFAQPPADTATAEMILESNGVNHTSLFPSQLTLFQRADADQQRRLIELWQISPPSYGGHALAHDLGNWPETSFQQEEAMAKLRLERRRLEENREWGYSTSMESQLSATDFYGPITPPAPGGREGEADRSFIRNAEPYIISGYQQASSDRDHYNRAVDPVYQNTDHWKDYVGRQDMECQYGALEQMHRSGGYQGEHIKANEGDEEMIL